MLKVKIAYDQDTENPNADEDYIKVYSFCTRHVNFMHPDEVPTDAMVIPLSYYEHGLCLWKLKDDANGYPFDCPWDSVPCAGVMVLPEEFKDLSAEEVKTRARAWIEYYTQWCNGECYYFTVEDEDGVLDSCGGFVGTYGLKEEIESIIKGQGYEVSGEAAWIME